MTAAAVLCILDCWKKMFISTIYGTIKKILRLAPIKLWVFVISFHYNSWASNAVRQWFFWPWFHALTNTVIKKSKNKYRELWNKTKANEDQWFHFYRFPIQVKDNTGESSTLTTFVNLLMILTNISFIFI